MNSIREKITNGAAAAAILAAGMGIAVLGVLTTLKASSESIRGVLAFYRPTGPLSGQTTIAVIVWLISWAALHRRWKARDVNFKRIFVVVLISLAIGLLGTFPPIFEVFFEAYE